MPDQVTRPCSTCAGVGRVYYPGDSMSLTCPTCLGARTTLVPQPQEVGDA